MISPQLQLITLQSHEKKRAPYEMRRGSATADDKFAYFTLWGSQFVYRYQWNTDKWEWFPKSPYWNPGLVIIDGELTTVGEYNGSHTNKLITFTFTLRPSQWVEYYPQMNINHSAPAVVSTPGGNYILVIGGWGGVGSWTTDPPYSPPTTISCPLRAVDHLNDSRGSGVHETIIDIDCDLIGSLLDIA